MRLHLPAVPGQPQTKRNSTEAFTNKVVRFAEMMVPRGHEVFIYGDPRADTKATEHVPCYPFSDPQPFTAAAWEPFNEAAAREIEKRAEPGDILALIGGNCQASLAARLPHLRVVEFGIGYPGSFAPFRVFESYAWANSTYGKEVVGGIGNIDPPFYDAVIPGYFNPDEFPERGDDMGYLLFVGRLIERKGVEIAVEVARRLGMTILLAGEGDYKPTSKFVHYIGTVEPDERAELMSGASCLLAPTTYSEPFGNIVPEAHLSGGCPTVTTDFGAFTETNPHGVTGYRARTMGEFVKATLMAQSLDRQAIRQRAVANYSYGAIAPKYEAYFDQLETLFTPEGFYTGWEGISTTHRYGTL